MKIINLSYSLPLIHAFDNAHDATPTSALGERKTRMHETDDEAEDAATLSHDGRWRVDATSHDMVSLLQRCANGDEYAFETLYIQTAAPLFVFACRMLGRADWAEEALQESYVNIWVRCASYLPERSAPVTWMKRIVKNRCIDKLRTPNPEISNADDFSLVDSWVDDAPGPLEHLIAKGDSRHVNRCLMNINKMQRQAITLAFFEDLSHSEIAAHMQLPLGSVKSLIRRGLKAMGDHMLPTK